MDMYKLEIEICLFKSTVRAIFNKEICQYVPVAYIIYAGNMESKITAFQYSSTTQIAIRYIIMNAVKCCRKLH